MSFLSIFNNREIATIGWAIMLLIWTLVRQPAFYKNIIDLFSAAIKMWKYFLPMIIYIILNVFILEKIGLWNNTFIKVTIFWFFGWTIVMFINSVKIGKEKGYLRKIIFDTISLSVFISFISNFYSFSLWFELLLVPLVVLITGLSAVASFNEKNKLVKKFVDRIMICLGLIIFCISIYRTFTHFDDFATLNTLIEFLIPILLSIMFIPFACSLSIYNHWEQKRFRAKYTKVKGS
jgi:hypothetical protein